MLFYYQANIDLKVQSRPIVLQVLLS